MNNAQNRQHAVERHRQRLGQLSDQELGRLLLQLENAPFSLPTVEREALFYVVGWRLRKSTS